MLAELEQLQAVPFGQKLSTSLVMEFKTLFRGKKWLIYTAFGLLPVFFSLISGDKLFGYSNARLAFIDTFMNTLIYWLFTFGCLILALPLSADEFSDHILDLYISRPFPREAIWLTRWVVVTVSIIIVNTFIALCYYVYFQLVDPKGSFASTLTSDKDPVTKITTLISNIPAILTELSTNSDLVWKMVVFLIVCSLAYSGIFLFIGFLGKNALAIGVIVAIFEVFISALFFIKDQFFLPRTGLQVLAINLFGSDYKYTFSVTPPTLTLGPIYFSSLDLSIIYLFVLAFAFFGAGAYLVKTREIA